MRRIVALVVALMLTSGLAGCSRYEPDASARLDPPAEFLAWWSKTEQCSGLHANFARVQWYVVPGDSFSCPGGRCVGHWEDDHTIYIAEDWLDNEMVVRHEMLHDLIDRPGHPDPPFGDGCPLTWATWSGRGSALRAHDSPPRID
jgi:hypothetical protein